MRREKESEMELLARKSPGCSQLHWGQFIWNFAPALIGFLQVGGGLNFLN